ncbi:MAG: hypothetical protein PVI09_22820, partial [Anaerolineae bacterium]
KRRNERRTIFQNSRFLLDLDTAMITYNTAASKSGERSPAVGTTKVLALDGQDLEVSNALPMRAERLIKQPAAWLD